MKPKLTFYFPKVRDGKVANYLLDICRMHSRAKRTPLALCWQ